MKHIKLFEEFLNEAKYDNYNGSYNKITRGVYPAKEYGDSSYYYQSNLDNELGSVGFDKSITLAKITKDPRFKELSDDAQHDILKVVGPGKGQNSTFVKDFVKALDTFGKDSQTGRHDELETCIYEAGSYLKSLNEKKTDDIVYQAYNGLGYSAKKALREKYGNYSDLYPTLTHEELSFIERYAKPKLESFVNQYFTDSKISQWIQSELKSRFDKSIAPPEEYYFSGTSWTTKGMEKPLEFVKKLIMDGDSIKWDSFKVKRKMLDAEHSAVVSSSFSTTYYYHVDLEFNGKKFNLPKVAGGSSYYSGGW